MDFRRYGAAVGTLAILAVVITTATATASAAVHHEGDRWRTSSPWTSTFAAGQPPSPAAASFTSSM